MTILFDISDRSVSFDTKLLGTIVFHRLNLPDWTKLAEQTENPDDLSAKQVVTRLISIAAYRKIGDSAPDRNNEEARLSPEQLEKQISDDEWSQIAEAYIELDQSSVKVKTTVIEKLDNGEEVSKEVVKNKIDLPRDAGEAAIDYLARIIKYNLKSATEHNRRLKELFDSDLTKQFRQASSAWSNLEDSLSLFRTQSQSTKTFAVRERPFLDTPQMDLKSFRSPLPDMKKSLEDIADHQAKLTPLMVNSANLLGQMYNVGSAVAEDFKKTIKQTSTYNKITIIIALLALCATVIFSCLSYLSSREASKLSTEQMNLLIQEVQRSSKNLEGMKDTNAKIEELLRERNKSENQMGRQKK